jgi:hypothetical protein
MTVLCMLFGVWAVYVSPYRAQQRSLAVVSRLQGGDVIRAPADGPAWQAWLVTTMLGPDAFQRIEHVDLSHRKLTDDDLGQLSGLVHLRSISLDHTPISDAGVAVFRSLPRLEKVSLRYTKITDAGIEHLSNVHGLRAAMLTGTNITDAGAAALAKNAELSQLYIRWTRITKAGAAKLAAALPGCAIYHYAVSPE